MPSLNPYIWAGIALVAAWAVYKISRLVAFKAEVKEKEKAERDERKKVDKLSDLLTDGHDINKHFGVRDK